MEVLITFGFISLVGIFAGLWLTYANVKKTKEGIIREISQAEKQLREDLEKADFSEFYKTDPGLELLTLLSHEKSKLQPAIHKEPKFISDEVVDDEFYEKSIEESDLSSPEHIHFGSRLPRIELMDDDLYKRLFSKPEKSLPNEEHPHTPQQIPKIEVMDEDLYQKLFGNLDTTSSKAELNVQQIGSKIREALRKTGFQHKYQRDDKTYTFDVPFRLKYSANDGKVAIIIDKSSLPRTFNLSNLRSTETDLSNILGTVVSIQSIDNSIIILTQIKDYVSADVKQKRKPPLAE